MLEADDPGLGYANGSLPYDELDDKTPYLCASFTGWRYRKMRLLCDWTREMDPDPPEPLKLGKEKGLIRNRIYDLDDLNDMEFAYYKIMQSDIRK